MIPRRGIIVPAALIMGCYSVGIGAGPVIVNVSSDGRMVGIVVGIDMDVRPARVRTVNSILMLIHAYRMVLGICSRTDRESGCRQNSGKGLHIYPPPLQAYPRQRGMLPLVPPAGCLRNQRVSGLEKDRPSAIKLICSNALSQLGLAKDCARGPGMGTSVRCRSWHDDQRGSALPRRVQSVCRRHDLNQHAAKLAMDKIHHERECDH